jgi:dihydropteroate synthase
LVLDPGFGFGKTLQHNLRLLRHLPALEIDRLPILAGLSRKSMLGAITGQSVDCRLSASISAALLAAQRGARVLRVHDVAATRDALAVWQAIEGD